MEEPNQPITPKGFQMSKENKDNLTVVVREHLAKGIIQKCTPCKNQFLSNIFLRPKPNGKHRLILDLSDLNDSVVYRHFKMESLQTAIDLVQQGCYMGSLDLSDAYYSIPVMEKDRKLLRFKWGGGTYTSSPVYQMDWHRHLELSLRYSGQYLLPYRKKDTPALAT